MEQYGAGFRLWYLPDLKNSEGGARQEQGKLPGTASRLTQPAIETF